eukprot:scaffold9262_cov287-Chaetoceros_neogracile.AAC.4
MLLLKQSCLESKLVLCVTRGYALRTDGSASWLKSSLVLLTSSFPFTYSTWLKMNRKAQKR